MEKQLLPFMWRSCKQITDSVELKTFDRQDHAVLDPAKLLEVLQAGAASRHLQLSQQGVTACFKKAVGITLPSISCNRAATGGRHIRYINFGPCAVSEARDLITKKLSVFDSLPTVMTQHDRQQMTLLEANSKQLQHEVAQLRELLILERAAHEDVYKSHDIAQAQTQQLLQTVERLEGIAKQTTSICNAARLPFLLAADYLVERTGCANLSCISDHVACQLQESGSAASTNDLAKVSVGVLDKACATRRATCIRSLMATSKDLSDVLLKLPDASELDTHASDVVLRGARIQAELLATLDWWRTWDANCFGGNTKELPQEVALLRANMALLMVTMLPIQEVEGVEVLRELRALRISRQED